MTPCSSRQKPAAKLDMDKLAKDVENYPDGYYWERAKWLNVGNSRSIMVLNGSRSATKKSVAPSQSE
ncbi:IS630 transposase-related protein [Pseudoalteromonas citrea]|uniref:IS630 transposase-related protein n=1 Tax=Pseudoalteromonas citrea TaxID=43655 RepID=UPI003D80AE48